MKPVKLELAKYLGAFCNCPVKELLNKQVNVGFTEADHAALREIHARHGIAPTDFTRTLVQAALAFYRERGFFSFPVRIEPQLFQRALLAAEDAGKYFSADDVERTISDELSRTGAAAASSTLSARKRRRSRGIGRA